MDHLTTFIDLLRHGEPEGGSRFRGTVDDPLSAAGWAQLVAATADHEWDAIVCSPLRRCREFAQALAAERGLACRVDPDFREINFGLWEGLTIPQVQAEYGAALTRFWQNPVAYPPPQGESVAAFGERVDAAWQRLLAEAQGRRVLVVAHGGVIAMVLRGVLGAPLSHAWRVRLGYAGRARLCLEYTEHGVLPALVTLTAGA